MLQKIIFPVLAGFFLDLLIGDPPGLYHPVRLIGTLISHLETGIRKIFPEDKKGERAGGALLVLLVVSISGGAVRLLLHLAGLLHPAAELALRTALCGWLFATRSLKEESMKVCERLNAGDLDGARKAVSMIVGRDTRQLDAEGIAKAAVETVAENTSDGIIAPMFYMVIGGPVLGWIYKAVNTMDSMVGYRNDRYRYFGRFAARVDDIANFIPARLSALLMVLSCRGARLDAKEAWRIFKRDRYNHASPNSAQTEAVMAGALHVQLAGDAWYFGKLHKKKTIGDAVRSVRAEDIRRANRLLYETAGLSLLLMLACRLLLMLALRQA